MVALSPHLSSRLAELERHFGRAGEGSCHCWTVVHDDEEPPVACPHGRPWSGVMRIRQVDRGPSLGM